MFLLELINSAVLHQHQQNPKRFEFFYILIYLAVYLSFTYFAISVCVQDSTWLEQRVHVVHLGLLEGVAAALSVILHIMTILQHQTTPKYLW